VKSEIKIMEEKLFGDSEIMLTTWPTLTEHAMFSGSDIRRIRPRSQSSTVLKLQLLPRGGMQGNFSS
jgi:hypothetical protein